MKTPNGAIYLALLCPNLARTISRNNSILELVPAFLRLKRNMQSCPKQVTLSVQHRFSNKTAVNPQTKGSIYNEYEKIKKSKKTRSLKRKTSF